MNKTFGSGRYQVIDKLGAGGMAVVYKAQDTVLNRIVTVKVLREQFASDEDFTRRFRREAQAVASLSHPNIVAIYDVGMEQDQEYIVMEFVDGQNLKEYIKQHAPLPAEQAVEIAKQICDALDHAHKHQIIHRDIKPHNILLTSDGRAKVTDFGIARAVSAATVTHTGTIVGSVHYFSPEQARGEVTNEQSDLYSLGIILYEMVTGNLPYDGESPISIALKHMTGEAQKPSVLNPAVQSNLEQVIMRAIAKHPEDRYSDARQFKLDLQRVAQGQSTLPFKPAKRSEDNQMTQVMRPVKEGNTAAQPRRRLKPYAWAAIIVLTLAMLGGAYALAKSYMVVEEVKMPDLTGMTVSEAAETLSLNKLHIGAENVARESSDTVAEGKIIRQDPEPGTPIKVTRTDIKVYVSQGPDKAALPDLLSTKTDLETALNMIRAAGFSKDPGINKVTNEAPVGTVIDQNPKPGADWPKSGDITLTVSQGPDNKLIKMPDVIGKLQNDAVTILNQDQYRFSVTTDTQASNEFPSGYVVSSSPKANEDVMQGSEVKLIISSGPGPVAKIIPANEISEILNNIVPGDSPHEVIIKVHDYRGWIQVDSFAYQGGAGYDKDIQYYPTAKLQILIDGQISYDNDYK